VFGRDSDRTHQVWYFENHGFPACRLKAFWSFQCAYCYGCRATFGHLFSSPRHITPKVTGRGVDVDERSEGAALSPLPFTDLFVWERCGGPPSATQTVDPRDDNKPFSGRQKLIQSSRVLHNARPSERKRLSTTIPPSGHHHEARVGRCQAPGLLRHPVSLRVKCERSVNHMLFLVLSPPDSRWRFGFRPAMQ